MPKPATHIVAWSEELNRYISKNATSAAPLVWQEDSTAWQNWLDEVKSFSFQGKAGQLSLVKENRPNGGSGYWYAYRRDGQRVLKKYAGRSASLDFERLESLARQFNLPLASAETSPTAGENRDFVTQQPSPTAPIPVAQVGETRVLPLTPPGSRQPSAPSPAILLEPKLQIPRLQPTLVRRERLLKRLDQAGALKLTLISTPAGFGKTTLVRQWLASLDPPPLTGWLSLDGADNDPLRFWRYVISACRSLLEDQGHSVLKQLPEMPQLLFEPISLQEMLVPFLNSLTISGQAGFLVLEDYHLIQNAFVHQTLEYFIDHLPLSLHLIIITRQEPPLPLIRLRAAGELLELATSDLRFTPTEVREFIQLVTGQTLEVELVSRLDEQLEGWAAGLRLLVLELEGQPGIESIIGRFTGSHRYIQAYFAGEVLGKLPEPLQDFILQTSFLNRLNASLCEAVTGRTEAGALLEKLAEANLFLEPLSEAGAWYRYHALFAEAIQPQARTRFSEELRRELLLKASRWYETNGFTPDAIATSLAARDLNRAARLIQWLAGHQHFMMGTGNPVEFSTLRGWLEQLPAELLGQYPLLCLSYATNLFMLAAQEPGRDVAALRRQIADNLQMAETSWRQTGNTAMLGQLFAFRALLARQQDRSKEALTWAKQALDWLPGDQTAWRGLCLSVLGFNEMTDGSLARAAEFLDQARILTADTGNPAFVRANSGMLSWAYLEQGQLQRAAAGFNRMLAEARQQGDLDDIAHATSALAQLNYEWNRLELAEKQVHEVFEIGRTQLDERLKLEAAFLLARICHRLGKADEAEALLQSRLGEIAGYQGYYSRLHELNQLQLKLAAGDYSPVRRRWDKLKQSLAPGSEPSQPFHLQLQETLLEVRLSLAEGETEAALAHLAETLATLNGLERYRAALEVRAIMALAYSIGHQIGRAKQLLGEVLAEARSEGYIRLFVDEGEPMRQLLLSLNPPVRSGPLHPYLQTVLQAFNPLPAEQIPVSALFELLSSQEGRVLGLLVAGLSNPEIARELVVSVNTVRSQLQSVYRKLGVNNRLAAAEAARRLNLA